VRGIHSHRNFARAKSITHAPAHRGANDAAITTDEDDQDGNVFLNHPEREGHFAA